MHIECGTKVFVVQGQEVREGRYVYAMTPKGVANGLARVTFPKDTQSHHDVPVGDVFLTPAEAEAGIKEKGVEAEKLKQVVPTAEELKAEAEAEAAKVKSE